MLVETLAAWIGAKAVEAVVGDVALRGSNQLVGTLCEALRESEPLQKELQEAFDEAWRGFVAYFQATAPVDHADLLNLEELSHSAAAVQCLAGLVNCAPDEVDTTELRAVFASHRPRHSSENDFDNAWTMLVRRFRRAAARDQTLNALLGFTHQARLEAYHSRQTTALEHLSANLPMLTGGPGTAAAHTNEQYLLQRYLDTFLREKRWADTRGLFMREREAVAQCVELRHVFVAPQLLRRTSTGTQYNKSSDSLTDGLTSEHITVSEDMERPDPEEVDEETFRERLALTAWDSASTNVSPDTLDEARASSDDSPQPPLSPCDVLTRHRQVVLLGPPGSGKSTLLRMIALSICTGDDSLVPHEIRNLVPVIVPLKTYASALRVDPRLPLRTFLEREFTEQLPHLGALIDRNQAVLLLDGLDEVFDGRDRLWVTDQVWSLMSSAHEAHIVITSRPHGYWSAPLSGPVPLFELVPFDAERIQSFLRGWFSAVAQHGGEMDAGLAPRERADALFEELVGREQLRAMASNPLLCTLIVLVHRSRSGRIPERRVEFFEAAVRTMAEVWETFKLAPRQDVHGLDYPEPDIVIAALSEVAWRASHEIGAREIPTKVLKKWLVTALAHHPEWRGSRGRRAVHDLLTLIEHRLGLLVSAGGDKYEFVHLSIHEYLVSRFIRDRLTEAQQLLIVLYYLHAPGWEEVLRLTLAGASRAQADVLLRGILAHPTSDVEDRVLRDTVFLCQCLSDRTQAGPAIRDQICDRVSTALEIIGEERCREVLSAVAKAGPMPAVVTRVCELLTQSSWTGRRAGLDFVRGIRSLDPRNVRPVLKLLLGEDWRARDAAFECVTNVDDERILRELCGHISSDVDRESAVAMSCLTKMGFASEEAVLAATMQLESTTWWRRSVAVRYLLRVTPPDAGLPAPILALAEDEHESVRMMVMQAAARLCQDPVDRAELLLSRFGDRGLDIAVTALRYLAERSSEVPELSRRVGHLFADVHNENRWFVVHAFSKLQLRDQCAHDILLAHVDDPSPWVALGVIEYFVAVWGPNDRVTDACEALAKYHEPARALATRLTERRPKQSKQALPADKENFGPGMPGAADPLVATAEEASLAGGSGRVLKEGGSGQTLGQPAADVGAGNDDASMDEDELNATVARLQTPDAYAALQTLLRWSSAGGIRIPEDSDAGRAVLDALDNESTWVCSAALRYMKECGFAGESTRTKLLEMLSRDSAWIRSAVLDLLSSMPSPDEHYRFRVLELLGYDATEEEAAMRCLEAWNCIQWAREQALAWISESDTRRIRAGLVYVVRAGLIGEVPGAALFCGLESLDWADALGQRIARALALSRAPPRRILDSVARFGQGITSFPFEDALIAALLGTEQEFRRRFRLELPGVPGCEESSPGGFLSLDEQLQRRMVRVFSAGRRPAIESVGQRRLE